MHRHLSTIIALSILSSILVGVTTNAYSIGDVDPRALRGVWRLTSLDEGGLPFERSKQRRGGGAGAGRAFFPPCSSSSSPRDPKTIWKLRGFLPMKEFTTYPKKKKSEMMRNNDGSSSSDNDTDVMQAKKQTEIFIKLKDDHTFQQCTALQFSDGSEQADEEATIENQLEMELTKREKESFAWKGTWDFVDGKLILAADRPEKKPFSIYEEEEDDGIVGGGKGGAKEMDTILVGRVAVQQEDSLMDNPALEQQRQNESGDDPSSSSSQQQQQPKKGTIDVHLSVPKGKIKTGKFMYPKHHPSFFEQPIYRPESKGRFELRQILGEYNAAVADDESDLVELFRKKDLVGKRFYLSTFPLKKRRKKFERWDVKENRYVTEEYEPTSEEKKEEELQPGKNMQVMAVELFANNTFSTLAGLGSSTVLRGKWSIIGDRRDQLWMMVYRFGFGRSVSGSTFSEGTSLTQNDEKGYWGKITQVEDAGKDSIEGDPAEWGSKKIEIKGAVMVGWGLEPCSVGRFKMIEMEDDMLEDDEDDADDEDEDEEEYEEMSADDMMENANSLDSILGSDDDSFDVPGAFE
mmetsp:Transcript_13096/g.22451  ORF Transcript_13096/g.22451 Transcript_13096/m.22451 type:complete len:576 (+) Transcript_13096:257-1984(+)